MAPKKKKAGAGRPKVAESLSSNTTRSGVSYSPPAGTSASSTALPVSSNTSTAAKARINDTPSKSHDESHVTSAPAMGLQLQPVFVFNGLSGGASVTPACMSAAQKGDAPKSSIGFKTGTPVTFGTPWTPSAPTNIFSAATGKSVFHDETTGARAAAPFGQPINDKSTHVFGSAYGGSAFGNRPFPTTPHTTPNEGFDTGLCSNPFNSNSTVLFGTSTSAGPFNTKPAGLFGVTPPGFGNRLSPFAAKRAPESASKCQDDDNTSNPAKRQKLSLDDSDKGRFQGLAARRTRNGRTEYLTIRTCWESLDELYQTEPHFVEAFQIPPGAQL